MYSMQSRKPRPDQGGWRPRHLGAGGLEGDAELELAIGVPLLDRSPKAVEPTAYGRALLRRGLAAFDELRQGVRDIEFLADR
jgi:hypothetical protein